MHLTEEEGFKLMRLVVDLFSRLASELTPEENEELNAVVMNLIRRVAARQTAQGIPGIVRELTSMMDALQRGASPAEIHDHQQRLMALFGTRGEA